MSRLHDIAQLLVASWALDDQQRRIPTSHGLLDRALKQVYAMREFPEWARHDLHFVDSRIGLQCVELPAILDWAQSAELTSAPNPSYRFTEVQVSPKAARLLLKRLGVSEDDASAWGKALKRMIDELQAQADFAPRALEAV